MNASGKIFLPLHMYLYTISFKKMNEICVKIYVAAYLYFTFVKHVKVTALAV